MKSLGELEAKIGAPLSRLRADGCVGILVAPRPATRPPSFDTEYGSSVGASVIHHADESFAVAITKRPGGLYPDRIFVGRARNCDVLLAAPGVSKSHAYFTRDAIGLRLSDANSTNGTFVRGRRLEGPEVVVLGADEDLRFGWFSCRYLSLEMLVSDALATDP